MLTMPSVNVFPSLEDLVWLPALDALSLELRRLLHVPRTIAAIGLGLRHVSKKEDPNPSVEIIPCSVRPSRP